MRLRAAQQLFLTYLLLLAVVVIALSYGAERTLRAHLSDTATTDLRRELHIGRAFYESNPELSPDSVADLLAELSGRRVTLIAPDGTVTGDSRVAAPDMRTVANHLDRREVRDALARGTGMDRRISGTVGTGHIYVAEMTARGDVIRFALPTAELDVAVRAVQRTVLSVGAAALILAALLSYGFSLFVTRPLRGMAVAARRMSGGGLDQRIRISRHDELGDLADALNALAGELQTRIGQLEEERAEMQALIDSMSEAVLAFDASATLRRANPAAVRIFGLPEDSRGVAAEVVDRRPEFLRLVRRAVGGEAVPPSDLSLTDRHLLASAHPLPAGGAVVVFLDVSEIRRLEGVRRDFVANASHELKTPLTAIRGFSETLLDDDLPDELRRQFTETVRTNAERLQRIVDDLLDLSRLESGGWRVAPERVGLEALAREVWAEALAGSPGKALEFRVDVANGADAVIADPAGLRQILANLLGNAARYTPHGGAVTLVAYPDTAIPERGGTIIEVRDTGPGIAVQHLPRIFERFYRADPARARADGGTGLGLAIVKHLVEAHGGRVDAQSEIGRGTTIRFNLPAPRQDRVAIPL